MQYTISSIDWSVNVINGLCLRVKSKLYWFVLERVV